MEPTSWVAGYLRAWESNDPADVRALFAADAVYRHHPAAEPIRGREAIVEFWLDRRDEPGTWTFDRLRVVSAADPAVVTGRTVYSTETYHNLWLVALDQEGRCLEFTEWWMTDPEEEQPT